MAAENSFGTIDINLRRLLTNSVKCVSDRLMIRSAGHMVYGTSAARDIKKLIPEVDSLQKAFDDEQKQKKIDSVTALKGKVHLYQKRKLLLLQACKAHDGPITNPNDVDKLIDRCREEKKPDTYIKKALKAEVTYARETYTKTPKTDDTFRIRDRLTNKDLTIEQYALNLKTLFSNIMAVATVPAEVVKGAIQRAVFHAGIEFISTEDTMQEAGASNTDLGPSATESNPDLTCLIDSPSFSINGFTVFISDYVAVGVVDEDGKKTWRLGMIDGVGSEGAKVSFFIPVPGRMGVNRIVFFGPNEDESFDIPTNSFLPLAPNVETSRLDAKEVFVVQNHEELDKVLASQ